MIRGVQQDVPEFVPDDPSNGSRIHLPRLYRTRVNRDSRQSLADSRAIDVNDGQHLSIHSVYPAKWQFKPALPCPYGHAANSMNPHNETGLQLSPCPCGSKLLLYGNSQLRGHRSVALQDRRISM